MKAVLLFFSVVVLLNISASNSFAQVSYGPERKQVFKNTDCARTDSCDLKQFTTVDQDFSVTIKDKPNELYRGLRFAAEYQTTNVEALRKYGLVQTINGCQYNSAKTAEGVKKWNGIVRPFYQKPVKATDKNGQEYWTHDDTNVLYFHKDHHIDGLNADPISWFTAEELMQDDRHLGYKWSPNPNKFFDDKAAKLVIDAEPLVPRLYVTDRPGIASYSSGTAKNISLVFKTCVFKAAQVPRNVSCDKFKSLGEPIHCFEWAYSQVFNHDKGVFESRPGFIEPYCAEAIDDSPDDQFPMACSSVDSGLIP